MRSNQNSGQRKYRRHNKSFHSEGGQLRESIQTFDLLSKNFDALQTLGESNLLDGFVLTTLNKLPQVTPDLVRTDDDWDRRLTQSLIQKCMVQTK